jgi:hypothetical protein
MEEDGNTASLIIQGGLVISSVLGYLIDMKNKVTFTSREFAQVMGIGYRTVMKWLAEGKVPGAVKRFTPIGEYWEIPSRAIRMERPKRGRPFGSGRG